MLVVATTFAWSFSKIVSLLYEKRGPKLPQRIFNASFRDLLCPFLSEFHAKLMFPASFGKQVVNVDLYFHSLSLILTCTSVADISHESSSMPFQLGLVGLGISWF